MLRGTIRSRDRERRRKRWLLLGGAALVLAILAFEAYRGVTLAMDLRESKTQLLAIKNDLDISRLQQSEEEILAKQQSLRDAQASLRSAKSFVRSDPFLFIAQPLPWVGKQAKGLKELVLAADEATRTGIQATNVALSFARHERDPSKTSIQDALGFLRSQQEPMTSVDAGLERLRARRDKLEDGLYGPLADARADLTTAIEKLDELVSGYKRANALLPTVLGYDSTKRYLVLPQNDTELFPSGGLISSYGIATFTDGSLVSMDLEYFGTLYDRWQRESNREYIEPPGPLKNYLKRHFSWGLGEAGWYPDFPTTGDLARSFVSKGGAPETDGIIAIDLKFIAELLRTLGPVDVPDYDVTVTAENVSQLTLELTRDETYEPDKPAKPFLSFLSRAVLNRVFSAPKDRWVDLLKLLDRMGRERHLQLNFVDPDLQALISEYGFDGSIDPESRAGDFLLIADTSVNSTKLNLIIAPRARLDLQLQTSGNVRTALNYEIHNPVDKWSAGRDPRLVKALMLDGVYGSYLRVYADPQASLIDARIDNRSVGPEQNGDELNKRVFGRFFPVLPGATSSVQFIYETQGVVKQVGANTYRYDLYIQKQAGTSALPLEIRLLLPSGAKLQQARIDGKDIGVPRIPTDLREDRVLEVVFTMP